MKFKKLISTITLGVFFLCSYSPVFASTTKEKEFLANELTQQEITEIIVKDPETKAWLESEESIYNNIPVTLVEEFPADVEADFDSMYSEIGLENSATTDAIEPRIAIAAGIPLANWLPNLVYSALVAAGLIPTLATVDGIVELVKATDVESDITSDSPEYYATNFKNKVVYVGEGITQNLAYTILKRSVSLGPTSNDTWSWKNRGNVMAKDYKNAVLLASYYEVMANGQASEVEGPHGDCGYYGHFHVGPAGINLNNYHTAHIWFFF